MERKLTLRTDSRFAYLSVERDGKTADVKRIGKNGGGSVQITAEDFAAAEKSMGITEDAPVDDSGPSRSIDLAADEAIRRLESGETLDLDGEDRKTVLRAAGAEPVE